MKGALALQAMRCKEMHIRFLDLLGLNLPAMTVQAGRHEIQNMPHCQLAQYS